MRKPKKSFGINQKLKAPKRQNSAKNTSTIIVENNLFYRLNDIVFFFLKKIIGFPFVHPLT